MKKLTVYCLIGIHLAFLCLVTLGGVLIWWQINIAYLHLPALLWAIVVELLRKDCPLTLWENQLRPWALMPTYEKGFVEHYVLLPAMGAHRPVKFELKLTLAIVALNIASYIAFCVLHWS